MIVDAFLIVLIGIMQTLYDLLPVFDFRSVVRSSSTYGTGYTPLGGYVQYTGPEALPIDYAWASMWQMNNFFPVNDVVIMFTITATVWGFILIYKGVKYIIGIIRGAGTS